MKKLSKRIIFVATIVAALASLISAVFGIVNFYQQNQAYRGNETKETYPFFKYSYDFSTKLFKVESYDYVRINSVEWILPEYKEYGVDLIEISSLTKDLSWYELRDYFAMNLSQKISTGKDFKTIQDATECLFFGYIQEGIPVVVEVYYDLRGRQGLSSKDLILLDRLDTDFPSVRFVGGIETDEQLSQLLSQHRKDMAYAYMSAVEMADGAHGEQSIKIYNGECAIRFDQPMHGF